MRDSGIPVVGDVPWGTHWCQFYQDDQDLIDILVPYFKAGLQQHEYCVWITSEPLRSAEALAALGREVENIEEYIGKGQLEILDSSEWCPPGGRFDPGPLPQAWTERLEAALEKGYDGMRFSGNASWLENSDWDAFTAHEAAADGVIGRRRMLAICTYSLQRCGAPEILDVVSNHAFALIKRAGIWQILERTDRKKTEASLRESDERLRLAVASTGLGTWDYDPSTRKVICSDLCKAHLGLPPGGQASREALLHSVHHADRDRARRLVDEALRPESGGYFHTECRIVGIEDGVERWVSAMGRAHFDRSGRPTRFVGTTLDVTDRKRTEEELLRNREWLAVTLASIGDGVLATDTAAKITFLNPVAARLMGWQPGEALGRSVRDVLQIIDEASGLPADDLVQRVLTEGRVVQLINHVALLTRDGRMVPIEDSAAPIRDPEGRVAGVVIVLRDVTAKRRSRDELARSEAKYRTLFASMAEGVQLWELVRGQDGAIRTWRLKDANPPTLRVWERAIEDVKGKTADEILGPGATDHYMPVVRKAFAEDTPQSFEDYHAKADRYCQTTVVPLGDTFIQTCTDITARKRAEAALRRTEARWNAAIDVVSDGIIIGTVSGQLIYWNPAARKMHGFTSRDEGVGSLEEARRTFEMWTVDGSRMLSMDEWPMWRLIRGEEVRNLELQVRRPDQDWARIMAYSGAVVETLDGECVVCLFVRDLTKLRQAERAAREGERKFQLVVESLPQIVWTCLADGLCDYLSPQWLAYTGRQEAEQLEYGWLEQAHPDDRAPLMTAWRTTVAQGANFEFEFRIRRHDGQYRWFRTLAVALRDDAGRITRWFGTNTDVHDRRLAERAVRQSRRDLDRAQAVGQIGSWSLDIRRNNLTWSAENHRIFGVPEGTALTYEAFLARVHPDDRSYVDTQWKAGMRGHPYDIEHRVLVDGEVKWVREKADLEFDPSGAALSGFGITQDITERKRAEEKIRQQNVVLEGMNRIFTEALSAETEEELGRRCLAIAEELTGSKFGFIAELNSEGRLDVLAISDPGWSACGMGDQERRRAPTGFTVHGIYGRVVQDGAGFFTNDPLRHPDHIGTPEGHPTLTCFLGAPLKHSGKTIGLVAVANREQGYRTEDLSCMEALAIAVVQVLMRRRAEQAARDSEAQLRHGQKMESIGVLAGGIAHDFNNLLTSILGNASLLPTHSGYAKPIRTILKSSEKAAALTKQLLAYAGKGKFQVADFDVCRLLRSCPELIRVSIPKNVEIEVNVPRNAPSVTGDSSQIQQVVMNLVINAAEAIGNRNGGKVSIQAAVRQFDSAAAARIGSGISEGQYIVLSVEDNGCGMSAKTMAKIFDPFFTTKFTGRGLGLAAVHGILASHHGAIQVESQLGAGSRFTIYLPCHDAPPEAIEPPGAAAKAERLTVLVVDDEEDICDFTKIALEQLGYEVLTAENGREALDILEDRDHIGLVMLDLVMPVLGGVETFAEIRTKWPHLAVMITSGYSEQESHRLGIPDEAWFLAKPFTAQALAEAVARRLKTSQVQ